MSSNIKSDLIRYNILYRNGTPEVNDAQYDKLLEKFKASVSEEEYNEFREKLFETPGKVKHPYIMGSLEKTKADEGDDSLVKWIKKNIVTDLFVAAKIDGLSVRLQYENGILTDAVTRGDGEYGESIYNKAFYFTQVQPPEKFTGHIRGEIVLTKENFVKLCELDNKDYANPRTSAVGLINSKDLNTEGLKLLKVVTYEIIGENSTKGEQYEHLKNMGFEVAKNIVIPINDINGIKETLFNLFMKYLDECDYEIDGLVLTSIYNQTFENVKIPKKMVAFKGNINTSESTIIDIEWNMSKNGLYKPVCIFEPIKLGGSMVSRATMYNYQWVKERNICYGDRIKILLSGEIIPKVIEILH